MRKSILNPVISRFIDTLALRIPDVDCARCTLSLKGGAVGERWFKFKCCTFQPFLANFYAGALLEEGFDPFTLIPGRAVLKPLGVVATREFKENYYAVKNDQRGAAHLCSYFDPVKRGCRIWKYRPGECGLYYCSSEQNALRESYSRKVFVLESSIAQMALAYYGLSNAELSHQVECLNSPEPAMRSIAETRAREIYLFAWNWLKGLDPEEVLSWVDFDKLELAE